MGLDKNLAEVNWDDALGMLVWGARGVGVYDLDSCSSAHQSCH